ncbi:Alpha/Beta hydrolase protein [Calycina marina]|uniref:Alpha/Beta hydrolase protein n=1 Tax=Calycina marina TaxID=1763456 RepID=A0A9P7Z5W5_9HELO|nr:Alpha/Beta hydrolase protein [Calycina marina]
MTSLDRISRLLSARTILVGTSVAATLAAIAVAQLAFHRIPPKIVPSPRATQLPKLSKAEQEDLPYPPDIFPGGRDVTSCYGIVRVYEWGPEEGRKVLLIHGISTPCISLGSIANALVEKGCRVMLFDLFGRGYSDSVDIIHDSRLYETEILLAITSSPCAWTPGGFSLIGYSLGGGIAVDFAVAHQDMVLSLVLMAPAGLIRHSRMSTSSRLIYSYAPADLLHWIVCRGMKRAVWKQNSTPGKQTPEDAISEENKGMNTPSFDATPLSKNRPDVTVASAVMWQMQNHEGFISSFISSLKYSSISGKQNIWRQLGLRNDKILLFAGSTDNVIVTEELKPDATEAIGAANLDYRVIEGGHEFPITAVDEVVTQISQVWGI